MNFAPGSAPEKPINKSMDYVAQSNAIKFQTLAITVNYSTEFGQSLWLVGSIPMFGNWDPNRGIALQWSAGHNWFVEIPFVKLNQEITKDHSAVEFKFVVRAEHGVVRWEGGGGNHKFDEQHVQKILNEPNVKSHIKNNMNKEVCSIGSFTGKGQIHLEGSHEAHNLPNNENKAKLSYNKSRSSLIYQ